MEANLLSFVWTSGLVIKERNVTVRGKAGH